MHEDLFRRHAGNYSLQTRSEVDGTMKELNDTAQTSASKVGDLVRANWQLMRLRKTIDAAFTDFDLVVLPTNRSGRVRLPRNSNVKRHGSSPNRKTSSTR